MARQLDQDDPILGLAPEGALTGREEACEPNPLEPNTRHRLRIARDEGESDARGLQSPQSSGGAGKCFPVARVGRSEQLDVALRVARAPRDQPAVDLGVAQACGVE